MRSSFPVVFARGLLALVLAVLAGIAPGVRAAPPAAPTGANTTPTEDEKKAIELVVKSGGMAELDPRLPADARVAAKFDAATDGVLMGLKRAPQIGALDVFDATRCTDKGLAALGALPNLRKLTLGKSEMTGPRAAAIAKCKELRTLYLAESGLDDAMLARLTPLTRLESLDVSDNPRVTDKGMESIKTLDRLQMLYLGKTGITDKGLMELKGLDGLRTLNVAGTKVTGGAADQFVDEMPNLRAVRR